MYSDLELILCDSHFNGAIEPALTSYQEQMVSDILPDSVYGKLRTESPFHIKKGSKKVA